MPLKKELDLSSVISSMAHSVDEAVKQMKDESISCTLEEFECSVELDTQVDTETLLNTKKVNGLKFSELKKMPYQTDASKNKVIIRAIFSPTPKEIL